MKRPRQRAKGFTVVEVLVTLPLMAVAFAGIAMTAVVSTRTDTKSHEAAAATSLAQAQLERMRNLARTHSAWVEGTHVQTGLDETGATCPQGVFSRQWTVDLDYNGRAKLSRVTVTASWSALPGQSVTLSSLYW